MIKSIAYQSFEHGDISHLKELCNELMIFQAKHAVIHPQVMASMNFDNRFAPDYAQAASKYMAVAYDADIAVGFAFATVSQVTKQVLTHRPEWAQQLSGMGFFPDAYSVPVTIGTFKLLYVSENYRGLNIGDTLSNMVMSWLRNQDDVEELWVYVANGNESVGKFYEKYGFAHSHSVFNGFIEAFSQKA